MHPTHSLSTMSRDVSTATISVESSAVVPAAMVAAGSTGTISVECSAGGSTATICFDSVTGPASTSVLFNGFAATISSSSFSSPRLRRKQNSSAPRMASKTTTISTIAQMGKGDGSSAGSTTISLSTSSTPASPTSMISPDGSSPSSVTPANWRSQSEKISDSASLIEDRKNRAEEPSANCITVSTSISTVCVSPSGPTTKVWFTCSMVISSAVSRLPLVEP
mmetsp:Transcript_34584/g.61687  ORF Transcript_34584/g.61687 Transcript_34584/m.61687 type:complete len:222 (-) Transcript_34584:1386-2051(-)